MTFGKKPLKDWNAQDNARNSMSYMLTAQARQHARKAADIRGRVICISAGVAMAVIVLVIQYIF